MIINYLLWVATGFTVGGFAYYYNRLKHSDLDLHLIVGGFISFGTAFIVQNTLWMDGANEINFVALCIAAIVTFFALEVIDFFYCLV